MKYHALLKDIFREMWKTRGKFLSIFLIIVLGTGFFAGVKAACPDMKETADKYYRDTNLMDFRLISTYGVTQEDVEALRTLDDVRDVMPAYSADAFAKCGDSDEVIVKILSLQDNHINKPTLLEGRLPEKEGECVVEQGTHTPSSFRIGETITLSSGEEDSDILDTLSTDTYTIVGIVQSSQYISFERGSSSIGDGSIDCFMMVESSDFVLDVYTDLYLTLNSTQGLSAFSDAYQDAIDAKVDVLEDFADIRADKRYQEIVDEATQALDEAKQKLDDAKQKQQEELLKAQTELDQGAADLQAAKDELTAGEAEIMSKETELVEGRNQLKTSQDELTQKKELSTQTFQEQEQTINEGYRKLEEQEASLKQQGLLTEEAAAAIAEERAELDISMEQLSASKEEALTQFDDAERLLAEKQSQLDEGAAALEQSKTELEQARSEIADAEQKLASGQAEYNEKKASTDQELGDAQQEINDSEQEIAALERPVWYVLDRSQNPGYSGFGTDAERVDAVAKVFPVFFILVAVLVCLTTMTRMVEEQRTQIGTLKALGYGKGAIMLKYLLYAGSASFLGSVIGLTCGFQLFPRIIFDAYGIMYIMPEISAPFRWDYAFWCTLVAILCTTLSALTACYAELLSQPAQLMRPRSPKAGKRVFLEYIPFIWKRLGFVKKVTARNIFRYKKRVLMTVIGIAGCTGLMLTGFGLKYAISSIATTQFTDIFLYDAIAAVQEDLSSDEMATLAQTLRGNPNVTQQLYVYQKSFDLSIGRKTVNANLFVPQDTSELPHYIALQERKSGQTIPLTDEGAVVNEKLARLLDLSVGDTFTLLNTNGEQIQIPVSGITENYTMNYVYVTPNLYVQLFGEEPAYNYTLLNIAKDEGVQETLAQQLVENGDILGVSFSTDIANSFKDIVTSLNYIVLVIIVSAGLLAFVVLYNLVNINVSERIRELATIKVLGFYDKEVSAYIYRENVVCTVMGIAVGLVAGVFLEKFVVRTAEVDVVMFTPDIDLMSFVYSAALTVAFTLIVNFVLHFRLKKISMVESLKSVE